MKPTIRITIEGGCVQAVEYFPGSGDEAKDDPIVMIWDFDCEGDGGTHKNPAGDEFNLGIWTPDVITLADLQCEEIIREDEDGDDE
jgi:hypothetical protein